MVAHDGHATYSQQKPSKLLFVHLSVNNMNTKIMIDTGSTISAITPAYLERIYHEPIHRAIKVCKAANNSDLKILGMVELKILVQNIATKVNAFIIENLCTDVLLGNDWCNNYNIDISYYFHDITIWVGNQSALVPFLTTIN